MNPHIDEAQIRLERAKDNYRRELRGVEAALARAVSQDPATLSDARAVQDAYAKIDFDAAGLAPLEQPVSGPSDPQVPDLSEPPAPEA